MSETVKVSKETKKNLFRVASRLQAQRGRRVNLNEAISHLLSSEERNPKLLDEAFNSIPKLSVQELYEERRVDEARVKRRHGL